MLRRTPPPAPRERAVWQEDLRAISADMEAAAAQASARPLENSLTSGRLLEFLAIQTIYIGK